MLILRRQAHARAGLVGNPSDGYHGKTISLIVRNFRAEVVLYEWEDVELVWTEPKHRYLAVLDPSWEWRLRVRAQPYPEA